ncbi:MAG: hypothetical protein IT572_01165 [Deltaproteobacteria bacterium]|nr:hypothetical protein [Deltaproteobacteria bacterium]
MPREAREAHRHGRQVPLHRHRPRPRRVVQRGTNHYWINEGKEPALLLGVLLDAEAPQK